LAALRVPVASAVGFFAFPITAMTAIPTIFAALCYVPSAPDTHPHRRFVENKRQSAIRPSGDRAVEALFLSFFASRIGVIFLVFFAL